MAKIHITKEIRPVGKKYAVCVNHNSYHFTSERAAKDFIRAVDNYLQEQFELLNVNLVNTYAITRRMSWYLTPYDRRSIRLQINNVEEAIELTLSRCGMPNYSSFSFNKLGVSIDTLIGILERMEEVSKRKKYTITCAEIRASLSSCNLQIDAALKFEFKNKKHKANSGKIIQIPTRKSKFN